MAQVRADGLQRGDRAGIRSLIERTPASVIRDQPLLPVPARWTAMQRQVRNLGRPGLVSWAKAPGRACRRLPPPRLRRGTARRPGHDPRAHRDDDDGTGRPVQGAIEGRGPWQLARERLRRDRVAIGAAVVIAVILAAPLVADAFGHGPAQQFRDKGITDSGLPVGPNGEFWLGTDNLGRDPLVRTLYGARVSLLVGVAATLCATAVGVVVGMSAGYFGGKVDAVLSRAMDVVLSPTCYWPWCWSNRSGCTASRTRRSTCWACQRAATALRRVVDQSAMAELISAAKTGTGEASAGTAIDPVCGCAVLLDDPDTITADVDGVTRAFCCAGCGRHFLAGKQDRTRPGGTPARTLRSPDDSAVHGASTTGELIFNNVPPPSATHTDIPREDRHRWPASAPFGAGPPSCSWRWPSPR